MLRNRTISALDSRRKNARNTSDCLTNIISSAPPPSFYGPLIGELAHLGFRAFSPHPQLREWVQCYWLTQHEILPGEGYHEKMYPDGGSTLTFYFNDGHSPQMVYEARYQLTSRYFHGKLNNIGVRFHPGGAYQLLGPQISGAFGCDVALTDLSLPEVNCLHQQLADTQDAGQRLQHIENWLLHQARAHDAQSGIIQHLWPRLLDTSNSLEVLTQNYPLSRRQIERKFQSQIGVSPAHIKILHHVKNARRLISQNPLHSLVDVALACGFYDQAHFIRQFRSVTQQTPGQYRARKMSQKYNSTQ